jgi:hypothetical protein
MIAIAILSMGLTSAAQTAVGTMGPVQTATITITNAGTLGTIYVLTQGAPNLDFQLATGGTCIAGALYGSNATCTVNYTFLPKAPGQRMRAVQLVDTTGTIPLGTTLLTGTGTGAALVFPGSTTKSMAGNGFVNPFGVAVDAAGDVFVADNALDEVVEIMAVNGATSSTSTVKTLASNFSSAAAFLPWGIAVDGAGNVYVTEQCCYAGTVQEIVAVGGVTSSNSTVKQLGSNFITPDAIAVDSAGNVFVADYYSGSVQEVVAEGGVTSSTSTMKQLGSNWVLPQSVAVDGAGNVYVADQFLGVQEILAVNGLTSSNSTVIPLGDNSIFTWSVAVDGAGKVYLGKDGSEVPVGIAELLLSTPPSLSFANAPVGNTSPDSPQNLLVQNVGTAPFALPVPSISAGFQLSSASTCPPGSSGDAAAASLAPGICTDLISFVPTA